MSPRFEPELRLLCALIAASPEAAGKAQCRAASDSDVHGDMRWDVFAGLITRHRVAALVEAGLVETGLAVPHEVRARLADAPLTNTQNFLRSVQCARQIVRACEGAGIVCAILKGVAVAQSAFAHTSQREMIDIDVLVDPARFDEAENLVLAMGFSRICPRADLTGDARASFRVMHNAFTFFRKSDGMQIDLHWQLVKNPRLLPNLNQSWQSRLTRLEAGGASLPVLEPVSHALYILAHGAKSGWVRLKWLADADRVVRLLDPLQMQHLLDMARDDRLERLVATSLQLTHTVLGTPLVTDAGAYADRYADQRLLALQLRLIAAPLPSKAKRLVDAWQLAARIEQSLRLKRTAGYRRAAWLRETANPEDLAVWSLAPQNLWQLGIVSPLLALARMLRLPFAARRPSEIPSGVQARD